MEYIKNVIISLYIVCIMDIILFCFFVLGEIKEIIKFYFLY